MEFYAHSLEGLPPEERQLFEENILSRITKEGKKQSLNEHLMGVAKKTADFASKIGLEQHGEFIGLLHDMGKASKEFQQYLLHQAGVAVLPRTSFGVKNASEDQEYIRLSYATSRENIIKGLKKIKDAIKRKIKYEQGTLIQ